MTLTKWFTWGEWMSLPSRIEYLPRNRNRRRRLYPNGWHRHHCRRKLLEQLEKRLVLSVTPSLGDNTADFFGDSADDQLYLRATPGGILEFSETGAEGSYSDDLSAEEGVQSLGISSETTVTVILDDGNDRLFIDGTLSSAFTMTGGELIYVGGNGAEDGIIVVDTLASHQPSDPGVGTITLGEAPNLSVVTYEGVEQVSLPFLEQVEYGLKGSFFSDLQDALNAGVWSEPIPLIGDQLKSEAAGQIASQIRAALDDFSVAEGDSANDVAARLQHSLSEFLEPGSTVTVQENSDASDVHFQLALSGSSMDTFDVDLALGEDPFLVPHLGIQEMVDVTTEWTFQLAFGVSLLDGLYIDTDSGEELTVEVNTQLRDNFVGVGKLGVFSAKMESSPNEVSDFSGNFTIDILDPSGDNRLLPSEWDELETTATLAGRGEVYLEVDAAFIPDLAEWSGDQELGIPKSNWDFNLSLSTNVTAIYDFPGLAPDDGSFEIEFANIQLDTSEYLGGFFAPVINTLKPVLAPLQPILELLRSPVPGISDLSELVSGKQTTFLDIAQFASGGPVTAGALHAISLVDTLVNADVPDREPDGAALPNIDLGGFQIRGHHRTHEITTTKITEPGAPPKETMKQHNDLYATVGGDLSFPLLEDPTNVFGLMRGEIDAAMFSLGLDLDLQFSWTTEWPTPIPGLEVRLEFAVGMALDLDAGYDTLGVRMLTDALDFTSWENLNNSLINNQSVLRDGFFLEDHLAAGAKDGDITSQELTVGGVFSDGDPMDDPELKFYARLGIGAKLGTPSGSPVEVSVGVNFPFQLDILFDLNDLPNRLIDSIEQEIGFDLAPTGSEYSEDGFVLTTSNTNGFNTGTAGMIAAKAGGDEFELTSTRDGEIFHLNSLVVDGTSSTTLTFEGTRFGGATVEQSFELVDGPQTLVFAQDFTDLTSVSWTPGLSNIDSIVAQWPKGTYPLDPAVFDYDGRVRLSEFQQILAADPLALFNAGGELSVALELYLRIYAGWEPFSISIVDKTWQLVSFTLFDFDLYTHLSDAEIVDGLVKNPPVLGQVSDGILELYMGPTGTSRQNTSLVGIGTDSKVDEEFSIRSLGLTDPDDAALGETVEVTYLNTFKQTFEGVQAIHADGGSGDDVIQVDSSVGVPVHFQGGDDNDRFVYRGTATALLEGNDGNDTLIGGVNNDILIGGNDFESSSSSNSVMGDLLEGGGGNDILVGGNATVAADGTVVLQSGGVGPGNDILRGGSGEDELFGQHGADLLEGGVGIDTLAGGTGGDRYIWDVGSGTDLFVEQPGTEDEYDQITIGGGVSLLGSGSNVGGYGYVDRDDQIALASDDGRLTVQTTAETLSLEGIEYVGVAAGGGADTVTIQSLAGTDVQRVAIDLSQPKEAVLGTGAQDKVIYEGSQDGDDTIQVVGALQAVPTTIVESDTVEEREKEVVQIIDVGSTESINYFILNSDPARDELEVRGLGGNDELSVSRGEGSAAAVSPAELIAVTLDGGGDDDRFFTTYANVKVQGGGGIDTDVLEVTDDRGTAGKPEVSVDQDAITVIHDNGTERLVSQVRYEDIEELVLNLGADDVHGNTVRVLSTISGPVAITGSTDSDEVTVVHSAGPLTINLGGPDDNDTLHIDRSQNVAELAGNLTVDAIDGLGLAGPIHYSGVEHMTLTLGPGAEVLSIEDTGTVTTVDAGEGDDVIEIQALSNLTTVNGKGGEDTVTVLVSDPDILITAPIFSHLGVSVETLQVRHEDTVPMDFRVEDGSVWIDRPSEDPVRVVDTLGADQVLIEGNGLGDTLTITETVPAAQSVLIDSGVVHVQHGVEVLRQTQDTFEPDPGGMLAPLLSADGQHIYTIGASHPGMNAFARSTDTGSISRVSSWLEEKLTGPEIRGEFGSSLAVSGDMAIVGAASSFGKPGAAYVFTRNALGQWQQMQTLTASVDEAPNDYFGRAVAISGNTAVVGASGDSGFRGAAYVFERDSSGVWNETQKLTVSDGIPYDNFGLSVAISGDAIVIGSWAEVSGLGVQAGAAYVFERNDTGQWTESQTLTASDEEAYDFFGTSVSISGDTIVVGANGDDDRGFHTGTSYVFERNVGLWTETQKLVASDAQGDDQLGYSVIVQDDRLIIGAPGDDLGRGAAFIYVQEDSGSWVESQKLTATNRVYAAFFGSSVALSGDTALIGAPYETDSVGAAYLFMEDESGLLTQRQKLIASDPQNYAEFGGAVAVSGDTAIVGARGDGILPDGSTPSYTGAAYIFQPWAGAGATSATLSPDENYVYAAGHHEGNVLIFSRNGSDGSLSDKLEVPVPGYVPVLRDALRASPDGRHLYLLTIGNEVLIFDRNTTDGSLSNPVTQALSGEGPKTITFAGEQAYVTYEDSNKLDVFARNAVTGELTLILQQTFVDGTDVVEGLAGPIAVAVSPDQRHLYVAGRDDNAIAIFSRDVATGELDFTGYVRNGSRGVRGLAGVASLAVSEQYVFAVGEEDDSLVVFNRGAGGQLTFAQRLKNLSGGVEGLENPNAVAVSPDDNRLYVTSSGQGSGRPGGLAWFSFHQDASAAQPLVVGYEKVDELTVRSGGGEDSVSVSGVGPDIIKLMLETGEGDDRVVTQNLPEDVTTVIRLGEGSDELDLRGSDPRATTEVYAEAGDDLIQVWGNGVESSTEIDAGIGDDEIRVVGDALQATILVDGDSPDTAPGDTLVFDAGGGDVEQTGIIPGDGSIKMLVSGFGVEFENIEAIETPNALPLAVIGGPYSLGEGGSLSLDASSSDPRGETWQWVEWDVNGDGEFGDLTGLQPDPLDWLTLSEFGLNDSGDYQVALRVTTSVGIDIASTTVTIEETTPAFVIGSDSDSLDEFTSYVLHLQANDPGDDRIKEWTIDWGDESTGEVQGDVAVASKRYALPGTYQVSVVAAEDEDGYYPIDWQQDVHVQAVEILSGAAITNEGQAYELTLNGPPIFDDSTWIIDWGDGSPLGTIEGAVATVLHTYADDGEVLIRATANHAHGTYSTTKPVTVGNVAPELLVTGPAATNEGSLYNLELVTTDPGNDQIEAWTIDWGDGTIESIRGDATSVSHRYADDSAHEPGGSYQITATAYDEDTTPEQPYEYAGVLEVAVGNVAPTTELSGPQQVNEGSWFRLIIDRPVDPGDDTVEAYKVDWGDGTPPQTIHLPDDPTLASAPNSSAYHVYAGNGVYAVAIKILDEDGTHDSASLDAIVVNVAPTIQIPGYAEVEQGMMLDIVGSFADPGQDTWTATVDYGDGSGTQVLPLAPDKTFVLDHVYTDIGDYVTEISVGDGDQTTVASMRISVLNGAIEVDAGPDLELDEGEPLARTVSFTDSGDTHWTAIVDYGDGSDPVTYSLQNQTSFQLDHIFADDGQYTVSVEVIDPAENVGTDSFVVTVQMWRRRYSILPSYRRQSRKPTQRS